MLKHFCAETLKNKPHKYEERVVDVIHEILEMRFLEGVVLIRNKESNNGNDNHLQVERPCNRVYK